MAGRIVHTPGPGPKAAHQCSGQPKARKQRPGTVWECDDCGKQWVVVSGQGEDGKGYDAWRELTEANRNGQDRF